MFDPKKLTREERNEFYDKIRLFYSGTDDDISKLTEEEIAYIDAKTREMENSIISQIFIQDILEIKDTVSRMDSLLTKDIIYRRSKPWSRARKNLRKYFNFPPKERG